MPPTPIPTTIDDTPALLGPALDADTFGVLPRDQDDIASVGGSRTGAVVERVRAEARAP